jgi:hypothetical protein
MADLLRLLGPSQAINNPNYYDNGSLSENKDEDEDTNMKAEDVQKQLDAERLEHIAQIKAKDNANIVGYSVGYI